MASRSWAGLSPAYRRRLERAGITQARYESGASVQVARGHGKTPEHPERATRNPAKYREYISERQDIIRRVLQKKARVFGDRIKYNATRSEYNVRHPVNRMGTPQTPNWAAMRRFLKMSNAEIDAIDWTADKEEYSFLFYH